MKTVFDGAQAHIAHLILRNLFDGKAPLEGQQLTVAEIVVTKEVARELVETGYVTSKGAITSKGRFAASYPHLAKEAK